MTLATPIILGLRGTPIRDVGIALGTPAILVLSGNATPCVLTTSPLALPVTFPEPPSEFNARAWRNTVIANGGTVSVGRLAIVQASIQSEMDAGTWDITDDYWALWGENEPQALTSLKLRMLSLAVNSPVFTPDLGYTFNGSTNYLNTQFVPSVNGVALAYNNIRIAVYPTIDVSMASAYDAGVNSTGNRTLRTISRTTNSARADVNTSGAPIFTLPVADARGFISFSRVGNTVSDVLGYKNGVAMTRTTDPTLFGATVPVDAVYIGGYRGSGGALAGPRASTTGFMAIGGSLTPAQEVSQYTNVPTWATAIGL